jgi:hypothetical protein
MSEYSERVKRSLEQGFYRVADLEKLEAKEVTHTIKCFLPEQFKFERTLDVLCFSDTARQLEVNLTNGDWLIKNLGEDPADWPRQQVTLHIGTYAYGNETKQGIRLKKPNGGAVTAPRQPPRPDDPDDEIPF